MSLRLFHLFFIGLSVALAIFISAWATGRYRVEQDPGYAVAAVAALAGGAALVVYAIRFRRKTRHF
jgi:hypothetical protein